MCCTNWPYLLTLHTDCTCWLYWLTYLLAALTDCTYGLYLMTALTDFAILILCTYCPSLKGKQPNVVYKFRLWQTDGLTDRWTLSHIELLSQLKIESLLLPTNGYLFATDLNSSSCNIKVIGLICSLNRTPFHGNMINHKRLLNANFVLCAWLDSNAFVST